MGSCECRSNGERLARCGGVGTDWRANPMWDNLRFNLGYTRSYANRMNLNAGVPHGELTSTGYALTNPGSIYLVYAPLGGSFTVNLSAVEGTLSVEWFNPSNGTTLNGGTTTGGASRSFTPPFSGDAVLYIHRPSSTTPTPHAPTLTPSVTPSSSATPMPSAPDDLHIFLPFIRRSALPQISRSR